MILESILDLQHHLMIAQARNEISLATLIDALEEVDYRLENVQFYKALSQMPEIQQGDENDGYGIPSYDVDIKDRLKRLMRDELVLDHSKCDPGEGPHRYYLLCAEIADEDMPWDSEQVDW
jgi:hypothetical protein